MNAALALTTALLIAALTAPANAGQRIVHGVETAEHPAVGAILDSFDPVTQHNAEFACSAVLIGCRTILTAAHCVPSGYTAGSFAVYLQHAGFLDVSSVTEHPAYDAESKVHDLAVVRLAAPVEGIAPIALNTTHDLAELGPGFPGTIVGFGRVGGEFEAWQYESGLKREGQVVTAACDSEIFDGANDHDFVCWDFREPLGEPGENSSTCDGDSGGPLLIDFDGQVKLAGITQGGSYDCLPPTQARDVSVFADAAWLAEQLEGDSVEACGETAAVGTATTPVFTLSDTVGPAHPVRIIRIPVRDDTSRVLVSMNASGDEAFDADLFVRVNAEASRTDFDCARIGDSLFASCDLRATDGGFVSVLVAARRDAGRFQLTVVEYNEEASVCGNSTLEMGEQCDGQDPGACPVGPCDGDCTCPDAVCGNGVLEDGEICDDGGTATGDGCDATCIAEVQESCEDAAILDLSSGFASDHGSTAGARNSYVGCGGKAGDTWYRFTLAQTTVFSAETDGAFDSTLSLYRGTCDGYSFVTCDDDQGAGPGSFLRNLRLQPGDYFLVVDGQGFSEGSYELFVSALEPGCGNGVTEPLTEGCDGFDEGHCGDGFCTEDCQCAPAACGNDVQEGQESCDGSDLGECLTGPCTEECHCAAPVCGNGIWEWQTEECDGNDGGHEECSGDDCGDDCRCIEAVCGDGVWDPLQESCDGAEIGHCRTGPCAADCTCPDGVCGNGIQEEYPFEFCDGSDLGRCAAGPCRADCTCPAAVCGNGIREPGESCDGEDNDRCSGKPCDEECNCPDPVCGNGEREPGEVCDGDDNPLCPEVACTLDCKCPAPVCGNGVREYDEECDGPGNIDCFVGECGNDCTCPEPVCGNGLLESGESCDGANLHACRRGPCQNDCECPPPACGNGVVEAFEQCDGPALGQCAVGPCSDDCECPPAECGNGIIEAFEQCDGEAVWNCPTGRCHDCVCGSAVCGDGIAHFPEPCDGDDLGYCEAGPCRNDCRCPDPVCGNDIAEDGEECDGTDEGYCAAGPCQSDCRCPEPVCGNDIVEWDESCDGARLGSCRLGPCSEDCECPAPVCGNSVVESGETCDGTKRGNCIAGPCEPDCTCPAPVCGNHVIEPGEKCDGLKKGICHNEPCDLDCTCPPPVCGDGIEEPEEICDGSAEYPFGYCEGLRPCQEDCTCPPAVCGDNRVEGDEECDGELSGLRGCPGQICGDDCRCVRYCGDRIVNLDEECDGYFSDECPSGICNDDCTCHEPPGPVCGNGVVEDDEECDGDNLAGNCPVGPCTPECRCPPPECGNGVFEAGESCESGVPGVCGDEPCDDQCGCAAGSACRDAVLLPSTPGLVDYETQGNTLGATSDAIGCGDESGEQWYRFSVSRHCLMEAFTDGEMDSYVSLFAGSCGSLKLMECDDNGGPTFGSRIGPIVIRPGEYMLVVDGSGGEEGEFTLTLDVEVWPCGDADDSGAVTANDALRVLRKSVTAEQECPLARCDASGDGEVSATDAHTVLRTSVGIATDLYCPRSVADARD